MAGIQGAHGKKKKGLLNGGEARSRKASWEKAHGQNPGDCTRPATSCQYKLKATVVLLLMTFNLSSSSKTKLMRKWETDRRREPFSTASRVHRNNERDSGPPSERLGITVTQNHCGPYQGGWYTCGRMNSEAATSVAPLARNQAERSWNSWRAPVQRVGGEPDMLWSLKL